MSSKSSADTPSLDTFDLRETVVALLSQELQCEREKREEARAKAKRRKRRIKDLRQKLKENVDCSLNASISPCKELSVCILIFIFRCDAMSKDTPTGGA